MPDKPANVEYVNIISGARISGTVYNQLNKLMKAKYTIEKSKQTSKKKANKPEEA
jgi:hypothetical protein